MTPILGRSEDPTIVEHWDLNSFLAHLPRSWLSGGDDGALVWARAPGRLDVMGGIADYSGALVLQLPLQEACQAAVRRLRASSDTSAEVVVTSHAGATRDGVRGEEFRLPLSALLVTKPDGTLAPIDYAACAALFRARPKSEHWAAYVVGVLLVLLHEGHVRPHGGSTADQVALGCPELAAGAERLEVFIASAVPEGKGVSSSAALEVASMRALAYAFGAHALLEDAVTLALLAQRAENAVVGAPCGVMDQMVSSTGERDALMVLSCRPAHLEGHVPIPPHIRLWGIDSGVRHSVGGSDYGTVRAAAFMGLALIRAHLRSHGQAERADQLQYLTQVSPSELGLGLAGVLPAAMRGAAFIAAHPEGHGDAVTAVDASREYAVCAAASHPIFEHARVELYEQLLRAPPSERQLSALGELMYQSHGSYSSCGLGADATDDIVRRARAHGPAHGVYGAKITGGGSGGTVCVLTDDSAAAAEAVREIAREYGLAHLPGGTPARIFEGSSHGAAVSGLTEIKRKC